MRWEDTAKSPQPQQFATDMRPDPPYRLSCRAYGHVPSCATYLEHLKRHRAERDAAGGEAQLKAKAGFWKRLDGRA